MMSASDGRPFILGDNSEQILLKPKKAFELLDISRSTGYALIASGEIPSIRIGRAVRVPVEGLKNWIRRQTDKRNSSINDEAPSVRE
jgi:excisionase family DNA binding protein